MVNYNFCVNGSDFHWVIGSTCILSCIFSVYIIQLDAVFFPELSSTPFLIHATSGGGFPEAVQATVTGDPWMKYFPPRERYISGASGR